jgi:hypothetical protein
VASGDDPPAAAKGTDPVLIDEVRRVARRVEQLRGKQFARPPEAVRAPESLTQTAATIRAYDVLPQRRLEARGRAWADLGLGDAGSPLALLQALAEDLEGFGFDPQGNRLLVAPERLTVQDFEPTGVAEDASAVLMATGVRPDEPVIAHQLVHVLQQQRAVAADPADATTDRLLARMAWAEGEANLVAVRYLFQGMRLEDEVLDLGLDPAEVLQGRLLPRRLNDLAGVDLALAQFIHFEGFARVAEIYRAEGWSAVDRALARGSTTRDLLHPARAQTAIPAFPEPAAPGKEPLVLADEDSLGEQVVVVLVSHWTGKDNLGLIAGDGWNGDRLYRWEPENGQAPERGITEWVTRCRDAATAKDLDYALGRMLAARFPGATLQSRGEADRWLAAETRVFRLRREGTEVRLRVAPAAWDAALEAPPD